jgi:hypothetical protein
MEALMAAKCTTTPYRIRLFLVTPTGIDGTAWLGPVSISRAYERT